MDELLTKIDTVQGLARMARRRLVNDRESMRAVFGVIVAVTQGTRARLSSTSEIGHCLKDEFPPMHDVWHHIVFIK